MAEKTVFVPFGPWAPDNSQLDNETLSKAEGVVPLYGTYASWGHSIQRSPGAPENFTGSHSHSGAESSTLQVLFPETASTSGGNWIAVTTDGDLIDIEEGASVIDEEQRDDTDFVCAHNAPTNANLLIDLTDGQDPSDHTSHEYQYAYSIQGTNGGAWEIVTELQEGGVQVGTNTNTESGTGDTALWTQVTVPISAVDAALITDYTDLQLEFDVTATGGGDQKIVPTILVTNDGHPASQSGAPSIIEAIDEGVDAFDDGDFVFMGGGITNPPFWNSMVVKLGSAIDPHVSTGHSIRVRHRNGSGVGAVGTTMELFQNNPFNDDDSVRIANWVLPDRASFTTDTFAISSAEADNITDYSELYLKFRIQWSPNFGRQEEISALDIVIPDGSNVQISWARMRLPRLGTLASSNSRVYWGSINNIYETQFVDGFDANNLVATTRLSSSYGLNDTPRSWDFASWGDDVIATNYADEVQIKSFSGTRFDDMITSTSDPRAAFVGIINNHVVLGNINYSGGGPGDPDGFPDELWWSAIDNAMDFDVSDTTGADRQRLRDTPGEITGIVGGNDYGLVFKERSIYKLLYSGPPLVFNIDIVSRNIGTVYPRSIVSAGADVYFWSGDGIYLLRGNEMQRISRGKVDRFLFGDPINQLSLNAHGDASKDYERESLVFGHYDQRSGLIFWIYRSRSDELMKNSFAVVYSVDYDTFTLLRDPFSEDDIDTTIRIIQALSGRALSGAGNGHIFSDLVSLGAFKFVGGSKGGMHVASPARAVDTELGTMAAQLRTKTLSTKALDLEGRDALVTKIRPIFFMDKEDQEPVSNGADNVMVQVEAGNNPRLSRKSTVTGTMDDADIDGWIPLNPPIRGEYFRFQLDLPSLKNTLDITPGPGGLVNNGGVREIKGLDVMFEVEGEY